MMKFLSIAFIIPLFCAIQQYHVKKIWLFSKTNYSGNVPVGQHGNQLKTDSSTLLCYIEEAKGVQLPSWQTAYIYGNKYAITVLPVNQDSLTVGTLKNTSSSLMIRAGTGCELVQLMLIRREKIEKPEAWKIILSGTLDHKAVYARSNELVAELSPVLAQ